MSDVGYVAALVVAATLVLAAVPKARAPHATAATFRALGLPLAPALARAVPAVEVAVAAVLAAVPLAGGVAALVLLAAFTVVLVRAVVAGVEVSCSCFGTSSHGPVSGVSVLRNGLLMGAAVVATGGRPGVPSLEAVVTVTVVAVVGAVVVALADVRRATGALWRVEVPS